MVGVVVVVVVGVVVVVVVGVVVAVETVVAVVVVAVLVVWQSWAASWLTVETPWSRSCRRFELIVEGRFETELARLRLALWALEQLPADTADET